MEGLHLANSKIPGRAEALVSTHIKNDDGTLIAVARKDIPKYVNEEFWQYYEIYRMSELFGLPNGKGWAEEPLDVVEAIAAIKTEFKTIESERMEDASRRP